MTVRVVILGAGGHARVVADALAAAGFSVAGVLTPDRPAGSRTVWGAPVLGDDGHLARLDPAETRLANGIGSTRDTGPRRAVFLRARDAGFDFPPIVHPRAVLAPDVVVGDGAQVMAGAVVQTGCVIGANVIVNTAATVDHDGRLGDHAHVAPGAVLSGGVTVGAGAHIGTGAVVIQNIRIGDAALVPAGAVVIGDVADAGSAPAPAQRVIRG